MLPTQVWLEHSGLSLYSHQARTVELAAAGYNVLTSTPTASGKSLCHFLPILNARFASPSATALLIYPVKALAQDQKAAYNRMLSEVMLACNGGGGGYGSTEPPPAHCAYVYDGDESDSGTRRWIRDHANVVITNPDMVFYSMLAPSGCWQRFLSNLAFVVIDESHAFHGIFGSNVALVLRQLLRLCDRQYGSRPRVLAASATIGNAREHMWNLTGLDFQIVSESGAPSAAKHVYIVQSRNKERGPTTVLCAIAMALLLEEFRKPPPLRGRLLIFVASRRQAEQVAQLLKLKFAEAGHRDLGGLVDPYRAGYSDKVRRALEDKLRSGKLLALVTTNALELGIDIGSVVRTRVSPAVCPEDLGKLPPPAPLHGLCWYSSALRPCRGCLTVSGGSAVCSPDAGGSSVMPRLDRLRGDLPAAWFLHGSCRKITS